MEVTETLSLDIHY